MLSNEARRAAREGTPPERYRTCCDCCHVKFGTVALGCIEVVVAGLILLGLVQQLIWKSSNFDDCYQNVFRDCLIFKFSHFNITLIFDYIIALMMIFILLSVLLMFCGILSDTSSLLVPHLIVQAFFLLFSLGYFCLYAWSYFYGDLYTHRREFDLQALVERMWLATVLLLLAAFQTYLFTAVVRCSLYLKKLDTVRRRRESAFERCSERVRKAKENGLWRTASWGGGFVQYKGQYDEKPVKEKKNKASHVQWGDDVIVTEFKTNQLLREIEERYELPPARPEHLFEKPDSKESDESTPTTKHKSNRDSREWMDDKELHKEHSPISVADRHKEKSHRTRGEEPLRRSTHSTTERPREKKVPPSPKKEEASFEMVELKMTEEYSHPLTHSMHRRERRHSSSSSPKKEFANVRRTESRTSSSSASSPKKDVFRKEQPGTTRSPLAGDDANPPSLHHTHSREAAHYKEMVSSRDHHVKHQSPTASTASASFKRRPPLTRAHKSIDSETMISYHHPPTRRRSSEGGDEGENSQKMGLTQDKIRVDSPHHFVKKVSITSTGGGAFV